MISPKFAKAILNEIFHTGGPATDLTADQEKSNLVASGVKWGITADEYFEAFKQDNYKTSGDANDELNDNKTAIQQSEWWSQSITFTESKEFSYTAPGGDPEKPSKKSFNGWKVGEPSGTQRVWYPTEAYLALFTAMPDRYGKGYVEPQYTEGGEATNYMRVNLKVGIITGEESLKNAYEDTQDGGSVIDNKEIIAYPEVEGDGWGEIVGFGVFDSKGVMTGTPIFWGELNNEGGKIDAIAKHVPLFRVGNFKVTIK